MKVLDFLGKIVQTIKLFPEIVTLPILVLLFIGIEKPLAYFDPTIALYGVDFIQVLLMAFIGVMFANAIAHGAIKYNQPKVWKEYKSWRNGGNKPQGYLTLLAIYIISFIVLVYLYS